jgi:hypothetical protein
MQLCFPHVTARVEIGNEILKWPPAGRAGLAGRWPESVTGFATEEIDLAWRAKSK